MESQTLERPAGDQVRMKEPMHRKGSIKGRVYAPTTLRERLIARRQELKLSQGDVAEKIIFWNNKKKENKKLSRSAYCMYESGEVVPDLDKIESLAKVFHCTPQWLAFGIIDDNTGSKVEEIDYDSQAVDFVAKRFWDLDTEWIRSRFEAEPADVVLCMVNDFSPSLKPGDLAIVKKGVEPGVGGGEFVFAQDDEMKVAFVSRIGGAGSGYRIYDADRRHHGEDVSPEALHFLGRVVGKMGDL